MGVTVLIDEFSASASEVFAGAIQDNDRGVIVGRRSFGKGFIQEPFPLPDGSELRLTIARYYTPSGRCIQKSYEKGNEDYYMDILYRLEHGEMFERDSINFDNSLQYLTGNGRVVFGGGGIMPDIFVPRDTSDITDFYLRMRRFIYPYALKYVDENRANLQKLNDASAINKYLDSKEVINDLLNYAKNEGLNINNEELKKSYKLINTQLKAYIARNIIDSDGFYPIIYEIDEVAKEAVSVIQSGKANTILNSTLSMQ
jgi:carboxyl-terminal processing protease